MQKQLFQTPCSAYRPMPFWSWNDRLEPKRIREQVRHMHSIGLGGFFMHSRQGLATAFLSDEWMEAVAAAVNEADKLGMQAWIYDEDRYPSGPAGGLSLERNFAAFAAKHLKFTDEANPGSVPGTMLGHFAYEQGPEGPVRVRPLADKELPQDSEHCLTFYWQNAAPSPWFNGFTYLDTLDADAVQSFIRHGLEPYKERFASFFGRQIPGVFTDEPQIYSERTGPTTSTLPWTQRLPIEFRKRCGYDLLVNLPSLVLDTANAQEVRYDFWLTVTKIFLENWCQPISDWCDQNGLLWTGHYWEHEFPYFHKAGSFMAPLAYLHVPGVDLLGGRAFVGKLPGDSIQRQMGNVQMIKLASSVAHQTGQERILSETYGGAMSDISFADQKIMGDWQYALGVNLLNQHLYHYSIRGLRKRDYPPSWGEHQPWAAEYDYLADYFGRLSYALSQGEFAADIALLHPVTVFWVKGFGRQDIARSFEDLCKDLTEANWDYDLVDEVLMKTMAGVKHGKLQVGKGCYSVLVLPEETVLASSTVDLLEDLIKGGGSVIYLGTPPKAVRQADNERLESLIPAMQAATDFASLEKTLYQAASRTVSVRFSYPGTQGEEPKEDYPRPRVYSHSRKLDDNLLVFLANVGEAPCPEGEVTIHHPGPLARLDLLTGEIQPLSYKQTAEGLKLHLRFLEAESHLLLVGIMAAEWASGLPYESTTDHMKEMKAITSGEWKVEPLSDNPLILDWCRYRINQSTWSKAIPIWEAYTKIRSHYGLATWRNNRDVQPWRQVQDRMPITADDQMDVELVFTIENLDKNQNPVRLVVESGGQYAISVNGSASIHPAGTWLDEAFTAFDITRWLQEGNNTITLSTTFSEMWELENSFIIGDFQVTPGAIGKPNIADFKLAPLGLGDWTKQGYPFYAGKMQYTTTFNWHAPVRGQALLQLEDLKAPIAGIYINGVFCSRIALPPYELDITPWVRSGENELRIVVTNSLRNLLDPLHHLTVHFIAGPETFSDPNNWQDEYNLVPQGLEGVKISWHR
ncbi:MAG: hypothetical protein GX354_08885 [Firmicutes bacterium]|nr:hypothetical protein [Bacillota bacterium]